VTDTFFFHSTLKIWELQISNSSVNNELDKMWNKAAATWFQILCVHFAAETEEDHEKPQSGRLASKLIFKGGTS
jgi:hypothetical protein